MLLDVVSVIPRADFQLELAFENGELLLAVVLTGPP